MNSENGPVEVSETDLVLGDGRTLHIYDTGVDGGLADFWLHGTPTWARRLRGCFPRQSAWPAVALS